MAANKNTYNPKITITVKVNAKELKKLDENVTDSFNQGKKKAKSFFDYMKKAGNAVFGGFFGKIGGMMASTLTRAFRKAGEEFLKLDTTIRKTMGLLSEQEIKKLGGIDGLKDIAKELSNQFGTDSSLISQNIFDAISLGAEKSEEAIKGILTTAEKLGKAADVESNTLVQAIQGITNTYTEFAGNAESVGDTMYLAMKRGAGELSDYAAGMKNVAATANLASVDMNQLAALGSALSTTTKNVNTAFVQTDAVLTALIKPSKQARDMLALINEQAGTNIQLGKEALKDQNLVEYLKGLEAASEKAGISFIEVVGKMFSRKQAMKGVSAFTDAAGETFEQTFEEMNEAAKNSGEVIEEAFSKMADSPKMTLDKLKQRLQNTFVDVIEQLFPMFEKLIPVLENLIPIIGNIGTAIAGILDSEPVKTFMWALTGISELLAHFFAPVEKARQEFDKLNVSILKNQETLKQLEGVEFNKTIVENSELLKKKIDDVNAVAPELAEKLRLISESSLDSSEKVELMNHALKDFNDTMKLTTEKDKTAALKEFTYATQDMVFEYNDVIDKVQDLEKNIGNLNEKQKTELLEYRKKAEQLRNQFKIESQKLVEMGIGQDVIDKSMKTIQDRMHAIVAKSGAFGAGFITENIGLLNTSIEDLYGNIAKAQQDIESQVKGTMEGYLSLLQESNNLQNINKGITTASVATLAEIKGFTQEQTAELERQLQLKQEALQFDLEVLEAQKAALMEEGGSADELKGIVEQINKTKEQIETVKLGIESIPKTLEINVDMKWVEAEKNLNDLKNSLTSLQERRKELSEMPFVTESQLKFFDDAIEKVREKVVDATYQIEAMEVTVTPNIEIDDESIQAEVEQVRNYFDTILQDKSANIGQTEENLDMIEATYQYHLQRINQMTFESEEEKQRQLLALEEQKNQAIQSLLFVEGEQETRIDNMIAQIDQITASGTGDKQRIQLEAILQQEQTRLEIMKAQTAEQMRQLETQRQQKLMELIALEEERRAKLAEPIDDAEIQKIERAFQEQRNVIDGEIKLLDSTIDGLEGTTRMQEGLVNNINQSISNMNQRQRQIEADAEAERKAQEQAEDERRRQEEAQWEAEKQEMHRREEEAKRLAEQQQQAWEAERKRREEAAEQYISEVYETDNELLKSFQSAIDEFNEIYSGGFLDQETKDKMVNALAENKAEIINNFLKSTTEEMEGLQFTDPESIERGFNMLNEYKNSVAELVQLMGEDIPEEMIKTLENASRELLSELSKKLDQAFRDQTTELLVKYGGEEYNWLRYTTEIEKRQAELTKEINTYTIKVDKLLQTLIDREEAASVNYENTEAGINGILNSIENLFDEIYGIAKSARGEGLTDEIAKLREELEGIEGLEDVLEFIEDTAIVKEGLDLEIGVESAEKELENFIREMLLSIVEKPSERERVQEADLEELVSIAGYGGVSTKYTERLRASTDEATQEMYSKYEDMILSLFLLAGETGEEISGMGVKSTMAGIEYIDDFVKENAEVINEINDQLISSSNEYDEVVTDHFADQKSEIIEMSDMVTEQKDSWYKLMEGIVEATIVFQDMQKEFDLYIDKMRLAGESELNILKKQEEQQLLLIEQKKKALVEGIEDVEIEHEITKLRLEQKRIVEEILQKELDLALLRAEYMNETEYGILEIQKEFLQNKLDELELQNELAKNQILMEVMSRKHTQEELDAAYEKMALLDEEFRNTEEYLETQIDITDITKQQAQIVADTITNLGSAMLDTGKAILKLFDVFDEGTKAIVEGVFDAAQSITGSIGQALGDSVAGIVFQAISAVIGIAGEIWKAAYEHKVKRLMEEGTEDLKEQQKIHEEINKLVDERNTYLEMAKRLHLETLDTLEEQIAFRNVTIEQLKEMLGLEAASNEEIIDRFNLLVEQEEILQDIQDSFNDLLEGDKKWSNSAKWLKDMGEYLERMGLSWEEIGIDVEQFGKAMTAAEREALAGMLEEYLISIGEEIDDINLLLDEMETNEEDVKKQVEERWKIRQLEAELLGDITGSYDAQIAYIKEMLRRANEFNLTTLEQLELEQQLQDLYEQRFDSILEQYEKEMELYILKAKLQGATEEELLDLQLEQIENMIAAKEIEIEQLGWTIDRELELAKLEEERLKLQQEINGELAEQGILLDRNVQRIIQQIINTRILGDLEAEEQAIQDAITILQNQGYSNQEIADLLGIDAASIPGGAGTIPPSTAGGLPSLPDFDVSNNLERLSMEGVNQLYELQSQTALLAEQNQILYQMLGVQKSVKKQAARPMTASDYHRTVQQLDNSSFQ